MDSAFERTFHGKTFKVKGIMSIPFEIELKAIDGDDAQELAEKKLDFDDLDVEHQKIIIEEVLRVHV